MEYLWNYIKSRENARKRSRELSNTISDLTNKRDECDESIKDFNKLYLKTIEIKRLSYAKIYLQPEEIYVSDSVYNQNKKIVYYRNIFGEIVYCDERQQVVINSPRLMRFFKIMAFSDENVIDFYNIHLILAKWRESILSPLGKDVVLIICKMVWTFAHAN